MTSVPESITIQTSRTSLAGTLYRPAELRGAIMMAPATGIRRGFYERCAEFLRARGYGVITFDNEGIGDSVSGKLARCDATLVTWGQSDMSAVLRRLMHEFPNTTYHLMGHSAGGQLVGLMDNAQDLDSIVAVAVSSGSIHNTRGRFRLSALFFFWVLLPLTSFFFGFARTDWARMGGPLPKRVAKQWGEWCCGRGYVEVELKKREIPNAYADLCVPSLWIHASDDDIANAANVQDMLRVYSALKPDLRCVQPADYGRRSLGHMGLFRQEAFMEDVASWLDEVEPV